MKETLKLAQDLEQYADMVENSELISPDEMNCASIMRLAAEALTEQSNEQEYQGSDAAKAAHMMDLYTALGVKFGEDPFAVIAKMRDAHLEQEPVAWLQFRDNEPPVVAPRDLGTPVFLGIRGGLAHDAGEKP